MTENDETALRHRVQYSPGREEDGTLPKVDAFAYFASVSASFDYVRSQWRRALGVNMHEWLAMTHLWESGPLAMSDLGERIGLSRAALTSLVDRLEQQGFLVRKTDDADRRRTIVSVLSAPFEKTYPLVEEPANHIRNMAADMTDEEWSGAIKLLTKMRDVFVRESKRLGDKTDEELRSMLAVTNQHK